MKATEKQAAQVAHRVVAAASDAEEVVARALARAERRGEERVLRWMRARGWDGAIVDYKQARRARVGRGR